MISYQCTRHNPSPPENQPRTPSPSSLPAATNPSSTSPPWMPPWSPSTAPSGCSSSATSTACGWSGALPTPRPPQETPAMSLQDLEAATDECLIANMPPNLRRALDEALATGMPPAKVLDMVRRITGGPSNPRGGLTYLQAVAYIHQQTGYEPA